MHGLRSARSWLLIATAAWLAPVGNSWADEARRLFERGIEQFNEGDLQQSLDTLQRAQDAAADPRLVARIQLHLGLNHAMIGDHARARPCFEKALSFDPTLELDPARFGPEIAKIFQAVRASLHGTLTATADLPDAVLHVDGRRLGRVPYEARLPVGSYQVIIRSPRGRQKYSRRAIIALERTTRVHARLRTPQRAAPGERSRGWSWDLSRRRWTTWATAATAGVAASVGLGFWVAGDGLQAERDTLSAIPENDRTPEQDKRRDELRSSIHAKDVAANALWVTGAALLGVSVALFIAEGYRSRPSGRRSLSLVPVAGPVTGLQLVRPF